MFRPYDESYDLLNAIHIEIKLLTVRVDEIGDLMTISGVYTKYLSASAGRMRQ